ncbi:hypothetical protein [Actinoplanes sp. DH11]|uniref:hypothetical protein n=1 Tax=Actinoplanes sp. DH11 TaxID=2857011 RepID=UPI001E2F11D2|nr:hypothetical protein [Actinoplanes sp. DH11]
MVKKWWAATASAAALGVALVAAVSGPPEGPQDETLVLVGRGGDRSGGRMHFELTGTPVRGLYPGAVKRMRITVDNPLGFRLSVRSLSARVTSSSRRGCPATPANLEVRDFTGALPAMVAARGRTDLAGSIPVAMPLGATEKCAGARFTIAVSGVGDRVAR